MDDTEKLRDKKGFRYVIIHSDEWALEYVFVRAGYSISSTVPVSRGLIIVQNILHDLRREWFSNLPIKAVKKNSIQMSRIHVETFGCVYRYTFPGGTKKESPFFRSTR